MKILNRRDFLTTLGYGSVGAYAAGSLLGISQILSCSGLSGQRKPNFVILFMDDMGYGDWTRGGHPTIYTPNMNRMAQEGIQMTQFYCASPVCSPSRAALLTGRNPIRNGVIEVFFPAHDKGLPLSEITIAEALKPLGYATACIGKWHLGCPQEYRPLNRGFDYYFGLLHSNDMWGPGLFRNNEWIEHPADQTTLTKRYTEEAIAFIERSKDKPFFLYLPHTMPHVPLYASDEFLGTSKRGLYGDVIEELDWSVGQILDTLDRLKLSENTLVLLTSDNGPWVTKKQEGGTSGLLHGAKGETWEGGMRVPFIARWRGHIPAGQVSTEVGSIIDFFPTLVELAGGSLPDDRPFDGINLMPTLKGEESPERIIYFYGSEHLQAVRKGNWKLHFSYLDTEEVGWENREEKWVTLETPLLYDIEVDPSEKYDVAADYPDIVEELTAIAERYKEEIRRNAENQELVDWFINEWSTSERSPQKGTQW